MKKKLTTLACICLILAMAWTMSGCGEQLESPVAVKNLEEPVFVKNLVSAEDMDVEIFYISEKSWEKTVKSIEIPNAPEEVDTTVYEDVPEEAGGYLLHTVSWGISVEPYSETYTEEHPLEFSEVKVTWDDGTETTADVGHIAIRSFKTGKELNAVSEGEGNDLENGKITYTKFTVQNPVSIIGVKIPFEAQTGELAGSMSINDVPLSKISREQPLTVSKGDECVVKYLASAFYQGNKEQYGRIFLESELVYLDQGGKEHSAMLNMFLAHGLTINDVSEHLKTQQ